MTVPIISTDELPQLAYMITEQHMTALNNLWWIEPPTKEQVLAHLQATINENEEYEEEYDF